MALHLHHLLLLLVLTPLRSTASATHSPESTAGSHHHHHRPPTVTLTATAHFHPVPSAAPSMHQNHLDTDTQSLLAVVDPVLADAQATESADALPALVVPPQAAAASPPPTLVAAPDLAEATPQPQEEGSASTSTTLLPLPATVAAASPPPPPAGSDAEQGLQQLSRVLASLGYNELASEAPLLALSPPLARWPGAITVFAAPDVFVQASCPMCSRRDLLEQHIAMGYYPSASVGFCIQVLTERGPFGIHYARIYADGVEVSHPELYNDGRYVVHGLHGFLRPLTHSCFDGPHHHLLTGTARSAAASAATAASVVRIMMRDAIARLRDRGYGFMALAMRVKLAELERFANLTLFALDDQDIFVGGGHHYVSALRFHIVPGHRLTQPTSFASALARSSPRWPARARVLGISHGDRIASGVRVCTRDGSGAWRA